MRRKGHTQREKARQTRNYGRIYRTEKQGILIVEYITGTHGGKKIDGKLYNR